MQDDGQWGPALLGRMKTAFETARRTGEDDFGHCYSTARSASYDYSGAACALPAAFLTLSTAAP
jgi:hypothetical protein